MALMVQHGCWMGAGVACWVLLQRVGCCVQGGGCWLALQLVAEMLGLPAN